MLYDNDQPTDTTSLGDRPQLSLCLIVRDNERTIRACLESIQPWVDEMVIVDTGSTDRTLEIAAEFGARIFHFPWCDDFSAARNESLRNARGQWLFWMDSDDTISIANGRKLRELADRPIGGAPLAYVMQVHCPGPEAEGGHDATVVDHVKMFRNRPDLRFEGRIHEQVLAAIRRLGGEVAWTDIFVIHSGSDQSEEGRRRKQQRDMRLIQLELAEHPDHTFHLFNLGMTHADMKDHSSAVEALRRSIAAATPGESHLRKAYALLVASLTQLARHEEAWRVCRDGLEIFPNDTELNFRQGIVAHQLGRLDDAVAAYRAALTKTDERHFSSIDHGITGYKARHNLAIVFGEQGRHDLAELQWRLVIEEVPTYVPGWRGLGESLLKLRRFTTCELLLDRLREPELEEEAALLRFELARARGDLGLARNRLGQAAQVYPENLDILRARCRFYFEQGEWSAAETALRELCNCEPGDAAAHHNLGTALNQRGAFREAADSYQASLRMRPAHEATLRCLMEVRGRLEQTSELGMELAAPA